MPNTIGYLNISNWKTRINDQTHDNLMSISKATREGSYGPVHMSSLDREANRAFVAC